MAEAEKVAAEGGAAEEPEEVEVAAAAAAAAAGEGGEAGEGAEEAAAGAEAEAGGASGEGESAAAPAEKAEAAADGSDDDLDLDDEDDGEGAGAAPATTTTTTTAAAAGSGAAAEADDDDDDDLDLDDSEEEQAAEQAAVKKKRKRGSNMFIEDSADESDDEGGTAAGEDEEDEGEDNNQYKIDGFVVEQDDDDGDDGDDGDDDSGGGRKESEEEEDEETRMARKRKQEEREARVAEDMVAEMKSLAQDHGIDVDTQKRKRLKKRADAADDEDDLDELEGVVDKDEQDDDDMLDEQEAQQSIQAEYRHEAADMFDMSEYDQMGDLEDEGDAAEQADEVGEEEEEEEGKAAVVDDDDDVDEKFKHIDKADLADNFMTKSDKEIEYADIPERLNLHVRGQHRPLLSGEPLSNDDLEEEAQWILSRAFESRIDLDAGTVANVLRHALVDKEDLPHILRYRKTSIMRPDGTMPLNEADIWKIMRWDARWDHFSHRHKKLLAAAAKLGDELDDDYLQMLKEAQQDEHLTDMELFLKLQTQLHDAGSSKGVKGAVAKAKAAGLGKVVEQFGLSAYLFGINLSIDMKKNDVVDSERMPEDLAQEFVCDLYPDADSVLRGSCNMLARQIADEPHVRRHVRAQYRTNVHISTKPTARGAESISVTDRLNGIRHIQKPIAALRGQEFLLIMEAEKARLIDVVLESTDPTWRSRLQQECEDFFLSDKENAVAAKWDDLRKIALTKAIENMLLPAMQHELRTELEFEARERLCDSYRQRFTKRIMRGSYSHRDAGKPEFVNDDEYDRGIKVLACVWDRDMKVNKDPTPVTCVLLSREGEHRETLELPFMQLSDSDRRKQDSCKLMTEFVKRHKPDVIAIGTNGRTSESLYQIFDLVVKSITDFRMAPPVFVDDEPARIYQHSKRALEELPDQNTLVKLAVAVGRLAHDPLGEVANLLCDTKDFEQLVVHPLQDMLDVSERMKIADECMVDAVNAFGVDINAVCRNKHSSAQLRYVSGLGPRKAKSIFDVVSAFPQPIESRSALVGQKLIGRTVYNSCAGFIRIDHARLQTDVEYRSDIELLDNTMVHPNLEGYDFGKKMAVDALDMDEESDDPQELNHKALLAILQRPDVLDELDLEQYAEQLEKTGHMKAGPMLEDIKKELKIKWWERKLPWKNLEGAELFQAVAGFHGRDIFVGQCEPAYYEGDIDTRQAYVPLDCQLRARLHEEQLELESQQLDPDKRFKYGEPLFYMMTKCTFDSRQSREDGLDMPPRFMIDVTRRDVGGGYGEPGLQSSIEWQCGILCDSFAVTRQNADKSKQNAGRNIKQRQIQHPDFQNVTFNGARRYLEGPGQGSDFVIRPSSQGTDHLTITIQFFEDIYLNVDIEERNTSAKASIGSPLVIEGEEYDDLDEVIYRFIHPYVDHARELVAYRKFTDMSREQIITRMKDDLSGGAQQSYYLTVNRDKKYEPFPLTVRTSQYPGRFCLYYMRKGNHHMEDVKCSNKGLRFRNEYFDHPEKLTAYFKKNFNRPPPRKKVERPAAMQKVEPNQQPSRGNGVKKEEPGYWGGTGMRVKGEQEDIKPQIGAGNQAGGWAQHSQPPQQQHQHQHQQHPTNSTFDAIAAADAARFAKMQSGPPARAEQPPPPSTGAGSWVQGGAWDSGPVGGSSGWDQGQRHSNPTQQMGWGPGGGQPAPPPAGANQPPPPGAGWGNLQQPQQGGGGGWGTQ